MTKSTHRALLSSVVALLICLTMLIGTTFAWFTDTAQTAVNTIKSGTLDIDLQIYENDKWVTATGKTLNFLVADKDGNKTQGTNILWEPGCTYDLPELRIVNNGNLALKYKVVISGIKGDAELNDVIDWTIKVDDTVYTTGSEIKLAPNATSKFTLSGSMNSTADNTYQDMKIEDIAITVVATQDTVEYDSTTNEYDKDAEYPETEQWTVVATLDALKTALNAGGNVKLGSNITGSGLFKLNSSSKAATLDLNGKTLTVNVISIDNGFSLTVSDSSASQTGKICGSPGSAEVFIAVLNGTLNVQSGTISPDYNNIAIYTNTSGNLNVSGGVITGARAVHSLGTSKISGGTIDGDIVNDGGILSITGGTFSVDPSGYVPSGYTVTSTDGKYTVAKSN